MGLFVEVVVIFRNGAGGSGTLGEGLISWRKDPRAAEEWQNSQDSAEATSGSQQHRSSMEPALTTTTVKSVSTSEEDNDISAEDQACHRVKPRTSKPTSRILRRSAPRISSGRSAQASSS